MIRGPDYLVPDPSLIQAITTTHPAATSVLIAGQWVQIAAPAADVIAQYDAARKTPRAGFAP